MTAQKNIGDLRTVIFDTIQDLKSGRIDTSKAKVISDLSQVMVNSARVEVDYLTATKQKSSPFLGGETKILPPGITGITRHTLEDD